MYDDNHNASPVNAIPPVILLLVLAIAAIEATFQVGAANLAGGGAGIGWRLNALNTFAFFDPLFDWMRQNRQMPFEGLYRFFTYGLVHVSAMHAIFACVMLLAIGKFVGERFRAPAVVALLLASCVAGALAYGLILDTRNPLIGAYPAVYGLLGAFTWILFMGYGMAGENRLKAFQLIALLMGLQLLFGLIDGGGGMEWVADIAGFVTGFVLSFVLAPGGLARLREVLARTRNR